MSENPENVDVVAEPAPSKSAGKLSESEILAEAKQSESAPVSTPGRYDSFSYKELNGMKKELFDNIKRYKEQLATHGEDGFYRSQLEKAEENFNSVSSHISSISGSEENLEITKVDTEVNSDEANEEAAQKAKDQLEQKEAIERVKAKTKEEIEALKVQRDEEIELEKSGRPLPFYVALFANPLLFLILMGVDSAIALIPVAGDFIGFGVLAVVWIIPCILIFDMDAYFTILGFLFFDLVFGLVGGSFANVIPLIGDAAIDAIPEVLVMFAALSGGSKK